MMMKYQVDVIERRVEQLTFYSDTHYDVQLMEQVHFPLHGDADPRVPTKMLLPIGWYGKSRIPDMLVTGPDGEKLAILDRPDRAKVMSSIITSSYQNPYFGLVGDTPETRGLWEVVQRLVGAIATENEDLAAGNRVALRRLLLTASRQQQVPVVNAGAEFLLRNSEFQDQLYPLVKTTMLIAVARCCPDDGALFTVTYRERLDSRDQAGSVSLGERILQSMGLIATPIVRLNPNVGKCRALYVLVELPPGLEPVRFFWENDRTSVPNPDTSEVGHNRGMLLAHGAVPIPNVGDEAPSASRLEVQVEPSATIISAGAVSLLLLFVATYIYERLPKLTTTDQTQVVALAAAFSGIPALLTGAIAYQGHHFSKKISRIPRSLLGLLAGLSATLAVTLALRGVGGRLTEGLAYSTAVYSFALIGYLAHIQFGPRWRQSDRGRMRSWSTKRSPKWCRDWQTLCAIAFVVVWIVATIAYGRVELALRTTHILNRHFPHNAWNAIRTWF